MRRAKHFATPGQILPELFRERNWTRQWELHEVHARWPEIAGPEAAAHSAPAALRDRTLWLYASNAVWAQELQFRQIELLRRVRTLMPDRTVSGIRCRVEPSWFAEETPLPRPCSPVEPVPESFGAIADDAGRDALIRLWRAWRGRRG